MNRRFGQPRLPRGIRYRHTWNVLRIGGQVYDPQDGATYTVRGDLDHGVIHPLRRFVADRKGEAASK